MNACEAMMHIEMDSNEPRAYKFLRQACELLDNTATIIHCPKCNNGYVREISCSCSPNPAGCSDCDFTGYIEQRCELCEGEGMVIVHSDGRMEAYL